MHLAYIDDSDTKCKQRKWQVMSAVLIEDTTFKFAEVAVTVAQESLGLSLEQLEKFEEFHACELYGGFGVFAGIDQEIRFDAMRKLLAVLPMLDLHVVYGAVDLEKLNREIYASADPIDICFRICAKGIRLWLDQNHDEKVQKKLGDNIENYTTDNMIPILLEQTMQDLVLVIMDECDKKTKESLHKTFRSLRPRAGFNGGRTMNEFHDDMYFGDSRYSFGIQLADACSYFIARHLEGDKGTESFYQMIEPSIAYHAIHPVSLEGLESSNAESTEETSDANE